MYLGRDFGVLQHFYKRRKPEYPKKTTDLPQVINKLYHIMLHWVHLSWAGFKLTTLLVIGTDCMGSYKSTTAPYIYLRNKINKTSPTITWFILYPFCIYLLLWEWISLSNIISKAKHEKRIAMRSPCQAKHIKDSMFYS